MKLTFFDAHTHVQFTAYDADRDAVMERARAAGTGMVNVGTTKATSLAAVELARKYPELCLSTIGIHPSHVSTSDYLDPHEMAAGGEEHLDVGFYKKLAVDSSVVAIGECGLDFFRISDEEVKEKQKKLFAEHIAFAREVKKPLMIHCRAAFLELIEVLKSHRAELSNPAGVIHFMSGTIGDAKELLDLDFSFTFGGVITFVRDYDELVRFIPIERILSETDAPYVAPIPYRGKRNEPAYVIEVVKRLASLKNISVEALREQLLKNTENAFRIEVS